MPTLGTATLRHGKTTPSIVTLRALYLTACPSFTIAWRKYKDLSPVLTTWTLTCCDVLSRNSHVKSDYVLATLVRLSNVVGDASSAIHEPQGQTEQQRRLIMLGLESQAQAVQQQIPPHIASLSMLPDPCAPFTTPGC